MRGLLADFAYWRARHFTDVANAAPDRLVRKIALYRADLWSLRENFLSGLLTLPEYRRAKRALRKRRKRGEKPRTFTSVSIRRPSTSPRGDDSRRAVTEWPRRPPATFTESA